jgi:NAD(P)-dependent dehydrogenase (short-subunit alcohol dehydrogenase family)
MPYLDELYSIRDRVVVITGGSGVLGGEIARGFLKAGARIVLLGRNADQLIRKKKELGGADGKVMTVPCDVLQEEALKKCEATITSQFSHIDILVNAAGGSVPDAAIGILQAVSDVTVENFRKANDTNFLGTVLPTLVFGKAIARRKRGSIINISSLAALRVITHGVAYSATKSAVENFTRWMAVEIANKFGCGLRVNAIAPGFLLTEQNRSLLTNPDGSYTEKGKAILRRTPFHRLGEPAELVGTALWLASDASRFVTGTTVPVDGGASIITGTS